MALPGLIVEVALELGPNDTPGGGDWTDLSDRVLAFTMNRGREDRTATFEPGTVSLTLDNSDDELNPLRVGSLVELAADKGLPLCPIRIQVTHNGVDYPRFYGYIGPECWIVERNRVDAGSTVRLDAVDRLGLFSQLGMPSSLYAAQVKWLSPDWWVRGIGGDVAAGNGDALRDSSGNGVVGEIAASGSDVIFETASLVDGDSDSAMLHQAGVAGFTDDATLIAARANMTMACVWRGDSDTVDQEIMRQRNMTSGFVRWRVECQVGGAIVATIYNTSGTATDFVSAPANPASAGRWDDGEPHIIFCRVEGGTRMRIWVDGQRDECVASIPATIAGRVIFGGGTEVAAFDEVAYWDSALPTLDINSITDAFMGTAPFSGDTFEERLERWWDLTDHPRGGSDLEADRGSTEPTAMLGASDMPSTLADAFDATAESFIGATYATVTGAVRVRTLGATAAFRGGPYVSNSGDYLTEQANFTDDLDPDPSPPPVRRSRPEFYGTRLDRIVNVSRVTWAGLEFSMRNDASVARYGARIRSWTSDMADVLDAVAAADAEVSDTDASYSAPRFEVKPVTIWPLMDDNAAEFAFVDCELECAVKLEWANDDGSFNFATLNIQGESWSWTDGTDLTIAYTLAAINAPVLEYREPPGSESFAYTGALQTFTMPTGYTQVTITANGASGAASHNGTTAAGGLGARVVSTVSAPALSTLNIYVGGAGADSTSVAANNVIPGGWNGGGDGFRMATGGRDGSSGGGATDIRSGGTTLADRVLVAGGGGAGGQGSVGGDGGTLGDDGATAGGNNTHGKGGTASAGGAGGVTQPGGADGGAGALGLGGDGGTTGGYAGAGGGGGYYGGGAGASFNASGNARSGGGGGSSYSSGTGTTITDGVNTGNGSVLIEWS